MMGTETEKFEISNGMTYRECASQKGSNHVYRKSFDSFRNMLGKSPQHVAILLVKKPFSRKPSSYFCPDF